MSGKIIAKVGNKIERHYFLNNTNLLQFMKHYERLAKTHGNVEVTIAPWDSKSDYDPIKYIKHK